MNLIQKVLLTILICLVISLSWLACNKVIKPDAISFIELNEVEDETLPRRTFILYAEDNSFYIAGKFERSFSFQDIQFSASSYLGTYIINMTSQGDIIWIQFLDSVIPTGLTMLSGEQLAISTFEPSANTSELMILDNLGVVLNEYTWEPNFSINAITSGESGDLFICGSKASNTTDFDPTHSTAVIGSLSGSNNGWIMRLTQDGKPTWINTLAVISESQDYSEFSTCYDVILTNDSIFLSGNYKGAIAYVAGDSANKLDSHKTLNFTCELDMDGNMLSMIEYDGEYLAIANDNIIINNAGYLQSLNLDLSENWSYPIPDNLIIHDIETDINDNIYIAGTFYNSTNSDFINQTSQLKALGRADAFLGIYNNQLMLEYSTMWGTNKTSDACIDVVVDKSGFVYGVGLFNKSDYFFLLEGLNN